MGLVKFLVTMLVVGGLTLGAIWMWQTFNITQPDDPVWVGINMRLPEPMRRWSCGEVRKRLVRVAQAPQGCQGLW
jgi:hypothetical protein